VAADRQHFTTEPNLRIYCNMHHNTLYGCKVTQCHCDPEVVTVHLFTLATIVFVLQLIVNTITISAVFFQFPSNSKEFKKWQGGGANGH